MKIILLALVALGMQVELRAQGANQDALLKLVAAAVNPDADGDQKERMRKGLVHYVMWVVVDPDVELRGANIALAKEALAAEARDGALLVFDLPESRQPSDEGGAAALMLRMARMVGEADLLPLSSQRFFALDFALSGVETHDSNGDNLKEAMGTPAT